MLRRFVRHITSFYKEESLFSCSRAVRGLLEEVAIDGVVVQVEFNVVSACSLSSCKGLDFSSNEISFLPPSRQFLYVSIEDDDPVPRDGVRFCSKQSLLAVRSDRKAIKLVPADLFFLDQVAGTSRIGRYRQTASGINSGKVRVDSLRIKEFFRGKPVLV